MPDDRLAELLSLGETSLRKLAESARQIQDSVNRGNRAGAALDAVGKLTGGISQLRKIFANARQITAPGNAQGVLSQARDSAKAAVLRGYPVVRETAMTALDRSEAYVKKQPYKGLLACLGLGLLLGVLIGR